MIKENRQKYADPSSLIRAAIMLLKHINYFQQAQKLEKALKLTIQYKNKINKLTTIEFSNYLLNLLKK